MKFTTHTTLDYIDNIRVPGNVFEEPTNEYHALLTLKLGLEYLYRQALRCDQVVKDKVNPRNELDYLGFGNIAELKQAPTALLTCAFHWYAISACQYARTVGAIAKRQDNNRPSALKYIESFMPELKAFRDKVGAHFARSSPDNDNRDNGAE